MNLHHDISDDWLAAAYEEGADPRLALLIEDHQKFYRYDETSGIIAFASYSQNPDSIRLFRVDTKANKFALLYEQEIGDARIEWIHLDLSADGRFISAALRAKSYHSGGGTVLRIWEGEELRYQEEDPTAKLRYDTDNESHQFFAVMHPAAKHFFCWTYGSQTLKVIHMPSGTVVKSLYESDMNAMNVTERGDKLLLSTSFGSLEVYSLPELERDTILEHSIGYDWWGPIGVGMNASGTVAIGFEGKDRDYYYDPNHQVDDRDSHLVMWLQDQDGDWQAHDALHFKGPLADVDAKTPFAIRAAGENIYWAGQVDEEHILWVEFPSLRQRMIPAESYTTDNLFFSRDASRLYYGSHCYCWEFQDFDIEPAAEPIVPLELHFPKEPEALPEWEGDWRDYWNPETGCLDLTGTGWKELNFLDEVPDLVTLILDDSDLLHLPQLKGHSRLRKISLNQCIVQDFSALAPLVWLEELSMQDCVFPDLDWLRGMTGLRMLDLKGTPTTELDALASLTQLEWLSIEETLVNDLSPLRGLPLRHLDLTKSKVADLVPLKANTTLEVLKASYIRLAAFQGSPQWKRLRRLELRVASIAPAELLKFPQLEHLDLSVTDLQDFSFLCKLPSLRELDVSNTAFNDLGHIAHLRELEYLNIRDTSLRTGLEVLVGMPLRDLRLFGKHFADLAPIGELQTLRRLDIVIDRFHDFGPMVARLTGLERLLIAGAGKQECQGSIEFLTPLKALKWLELNMGVVDDMAPLAQLTSLEYLHIWVSSISHHTSLAPLTRLKWLRWSYRSQGFGTVPDIFTGLTQLEHFHASLEPFASTDFLKGFPNLRFLKVHGFRGKIQDVLANTPLLESLDFDGDALAGLSHVPNLKHLMTNGGGDPKPGFLLRRLRTLSLSFSNFPLQQLENLTGLRSLSLSGDSFQDLNALPALPSLRKLNLRGLGGESVSRIAALTGLVQLELSDCKLKKFPDLSALSCLYEVSLKNMTILDATALGSMRKLHKLELEYPHFSSFDWLAQLQDLRAYRVGIVGHRAEKGDATNMDSLFALRKLQDISLKTDLITEIPNWNFLENVEYAWLDLSALAKVPRKTRPLPKLRSLYFYTSHPVDFGFLHHCSGLKSLDVSCTYFGDLSVIQPMKHLRKLKIYHTSVRSLAPISGLPTLRDLEIPNSVANGLDDVAKITTLEDLRFEGVAVPSFAPLRSLPYLKWIAGSIPADGDISVLAEKKCLKTIMLQNGEINSLEPLFPMILSGQIDHLSMLSASVKSLPPGLKFDRYDFMKNLKAWAAQRGKV